jgi:hypothetical protein
MTDFPDLKLKALLTFPGTVIGGTGLTATKANGSITLDYAWQEFGQISAIPTQPTAMILTYDTATNAYVMVPSHLLGGAVAGISDAPVDTNTYGRLNAAWTKVLPLTGGTMSGPVTLSGTTTAGQINAGDIYAIRSPSSGAVFFGSTPAAYIFYDGSGFQIQGSIDSPVMTGAPRAPTAAPGTNNVQVATTAFVAAAVAAAGGGSGTVANPTATIGLSPVNGTASSALRSDGAPALSQAIAPVWTGTHNFNNGSYSALFSGGPVGIGNAIPTATLHVGGVAAASAGANILSARASTGTTSVHGFAENSTINLSAAGQGMDSYDARMVVTGTQSYDHFVSYQSRAIYGSSGVCTWGYGSWDGFTANGPLTNYASHYIAQATGTGTIGTAYGVYCEALNKATVNYGFYMPYSSAGGWNSASFGGLTIGHSANWYPGFGYNVQYQPGSVIYKYATPDTASMFVFGFSGRIETYTAPSGAAGATIAFTAGPYLAQAGTSWTTASDARFKENVATIDVLARLGQYRAVSFDWIENGRHDVGVIAQELETSFPELVDHTDPDRLGVNYSQLGAMALGGVKQLHDMIAALQAEVAALKAKT